MTLVEIIGNQQVSIHALKEQVRQVEKNYDLLIEAAKKVYYAGQWSLPDPTTLITSLSHEEQAKLWEDFRDAAGFEKGATSEQRVTELDATEESLGKRSA